MRIQKKKNRSRRWGILLCLSVVLSNMPMSSLPTFAVDAVEQEIETEGKEDFVVESLKKEISVFPSVEEIQEMNFEEQSEAYMKLQNLGDEYEALSEQQKLQLSEEEKILEDLFAYFSGSDMIEPSLCKNIYLRVYDRVTGGYVNNVKVTIVGNNKTIYAYNGNNLYDLGMTAKTTYTFSASQAGYDIPTVEKEVNVTTNMTTSMDVEFFVYKTYDLTVNVRDSLGNAVSGTTVSMSGPKTGTATTNNQGSCVFKDIRGLYTEEVSVTYRDAFGAEKTVSAKAYLKNTQTINLVIPAETKISTTVKSNDGVLITDATVVVKNTNNETVSLSHKGNGVYEGAAKRTAANDTFSIEVTAKGYDQKTQTVESKAGTAVNTNISMSRKAIKVIDKKSNQTLSNSMSMNTGNTYTLAVSPETLPSGVSAFCKIAGNDEKLVVKETDDSATWSIIPKKTGTVTLQIGYSWIQNDRPVSQMKEITITVGKGTVSHPSVTLSLEDTDQRTETFTLPDNALCTEKLVIKATGAINKEWDCSNIDSGSICVDLSDKVIHGEITYTFTCVSDQVVYTGSAASITKTYYESTTLNLAKTQLTYNGKVQIPQLTVKDSQGNLIDSNNYEIKITSGDTLIDPIKVTPLYGYDSKLGYTVNVTMKNDCYYKAPEKQYYGISIRNVIITAQDQAIDANSAIDQTAYKVTGDGIAEGESLIVNLKRNGNEIKIDSVLIKNSADQEVYRNNPTHWYDVLSYCYTVTLEPGKVLKNLDSDWVTLSSETLEYNGESRIPTATIKDGSISLGKDSDYKLSLEDAKGEQIDKAIFSGTYYLVIEGIGNYAGTIKQKFTITQKEITILAKDQEITYGETIGTGVDQLEVQGLAETDSITAVKISTQVKDVTAEGKIQISNVSIKKGNQDVTGCYKIEYKEGNLTIVQRPLTVTGWIVKDKIYDGSVLASLDEESLTISNLADGEDLKVSAVGTFENKKVNYNDEQQVVPKTVSINEIVFADGTNGKASNYRLDIENSQPTASATIFPKELTLTVKVKDKYYNGKNNAEIESAALMGVLEEDDVDLIFGVPSFTQIKAGKDIAVIFTEFTIEGEDAGNYYVTQPVGITGNIFNNWKPADNSSNIFIEGTADKMETDGNLTNIADIANTADESTTLEWASLLLISFIVFLQLIFENKKQKK